jgi:hypothetical protein
MLDESRGLYSLMRTAPATSGVGRCSLTNVKPLVLSGAHTGSILEPGSREISSATADGQAEKINTIYFHYKEIRDTSLKQSFKTLLLIL